MPPDDPIQNPTPNPNEAPSKPSASGLGLASGFLVLLVMVASMVWNAHTWSGEMYQKYIDALNQQNSCNVIQQTK